MSEDRSVFDLVEPASSELITYGDSTDQVIEFFRATGVTSETGALKKKIGLIHGGYWRPEYDRAHLRPYAARLASEGFDTFLIEYRRTQGSPDHFIEDIKSALEVIGDCTLIGHSAGGHLALLASNMPQVHRVVALAPLSDLVRGEALNLDGGAITLFLGCDAGDRPDLDPMRLKTLNVPVTVLHGVDDERVPVELSQSFAEKFKEIEYIEMPDIGHFELIDPRKDSIIRLVVSALQ
jgi:pimeloyl-ACP methyl ester carboxylesterase